MFPPQARPCCPLVPPPVPRSFPHNPLSNIYSFWPFEQLGASALHRDPLSCLPQNCRPRTLGQPSVTPTKPAWSLRGRKRGVVLLDRSKPCRVDWPPQSGWQVAVSPHLSTQHYLTFLPIEAPQPDLGPNPRPPFHCPHGQLPLHTSPPHPDTQDVIYPVVFPSVSPSTPTIPSQRSRALWGVWGKAPFMKGERGRGSQMPSPLLLPTSKLWE